MESLKKLLGSVGWGASLYPSGHFCLWRKHGKKTIGFKEAFVSAGAGIFRDRDLADVQQVYGKETVREWWKAAKDVDVPGLRSHAAEANSAVVTLGSSTPANSEKKPRGMGGLTSRGKNLVREGASALEKTWGRRRLTFWTVTLPAMTEADYQAVCKHWSEICTNLKKKLIYHLRKAGLPTEVVAVTEMQEARWEKQKVPAWHIHLVFVGCRLNGGWVLTPSLADKLWSEAVSVHTANPYRFQSSSRLERVRKSVSAYMSKYLSKGSSVIAACAEAWPGCIPSSWYVCTKLLRSWVDSSTLKGDAIALWLRQLTMDSASEIKGLWAYCVETRPGQKLAVCWMGTLPDPPIPKEPLDSYVTRMT